MNNTLAAWFLTPHYLRFDTLSKTKAQHFRRVLVFIARWERDTGRGRRVAGDEPGDA